jgi:hypothetical protein
VVRNTNDKRIALPLDRPHRPQTKLFSCFEHFLNTPSAHSGQVKPVSFFQLNRRLAVELLGGREQEAQAANLREVKTTLARLRVPKGALYRYTDQVRELCASETALQNENTGLENERAKVRLQLASIKRESLSCEDDVQRATSDRFKAF